MSTVSPIQAITPLSICEEDGNIGIGRVSSPTTGTTSINTSSTARTTSPSVKKNKKQNKSSKNNKNGGKSISSTTPTSAVGTTKSFSTKEKGTDLDSSASAPPLSECLLEVAPPKVVTPPRPYRHNPYQAQESSNSSSLVYYTSSSNNQESTTKKEQNDNPTPEVDYSLMPVFQQPHADGGAYMYDPSGYYGNTDYCNNNITSVAMKQYDNYQPMPVPNEPSSLAASSPSAGLTANVPQEHLHISLVHRQSFASTSSLSQFTAGESEHYNVSDMSLSTTALMDDLCSQASSSQGMQSPSTRTTTITTTSTRNSLVPNSSPTYGSAVSYTMNPPFKGTLHYTPLAGRMSFCPYPTVAFNFPAPRFPKSHMVRMFIGQVPYHVTAMQLSWILYTFGAGANLHHFESITKTDHKQGGVKVPTGCFHCYVEQEQVGPLTKTINDKLLIDDTGIWTANSDAEAAILSSYCHSMKIDKNRRVHGRPYGTVVAQVATSTFDPDTFVRRPGAPGGFQRHCM